jgi:hypothetical protein
MDISTWITILMLVKTTIFILAIMFSMTLIRDIALCVAYTIKDTDWTMPARVITIPAVLWGLFMLANYYQSVLSSLI